MIAHREVCQAVMIAQVNAVMKQRGQHPVDVLMTTTMHSERACLGAIRTATRLGYVRVEGSQQPTLTELGYAEADATVDLENGKTIRADPHTWRQALERMDSGLATMTFAKATA